MIPDRHTPGQFSLARQKGPQNPTARKDDNSLGSFSFTAVMFCPFIVFWEIKEAILYHHKPKALLFDRRKKLPAPSTCA